jgi:hypothetical protein
MAFGFEIIKDGIFKRTYTVYDLAQDNVVFQAETIGMFNPEIIISNAEGFEEIRCIKTGGWRSNWRVEKKGFHLFEFSYSGSICAGEYIIKTNIERYRSPKSMSSYFEFHNEIGKIVFSVNRRNFSGKILVEVREDFEPLIAIGTAFILNFIIEQQAAAGATVAVTAGV